MKEYFFYSKSDVSKEPIHYCKSSSRLNAAKTFSEIKQLPLKKFLTLFGVSR